MKFEDMELDIKNNLQLAQRKFRNMQNEEFY